MENIIIYPENDEQKQFLRTLLQELKVKFEIGENSDAALSESDYYKKIDESIKQFAEGKTIILTQEKQKKLLGL